MGGGRKIKKYIYIYIYKTFKAFKTFKTSKKMGGVEKKKKNF